jgi:hypothetical protein
MPIVFSTYIIGPIQIDGRRWVRETHIDHTGVSHEREYLAVDGSDYSGIMTTQAAWLANELKTAELNWIEAELLAGRNPFPKQSGDFVWNTRSEALQFVFSVLMPRPAVEVAHLAPLLNAVTDVELSVAGYTSEQIATLRARVVELTTLLPTLIAPAFGG